MKRSLITSLILLLIFPLVVFADETEFSVSIWDVEDEANAKNVCISAADAANKSTTNNDGKNKTYAQCVEITCENNKVVHKTIDAFSDMRTCDNGNTNPYTEVSKSGVSSTETDLLEGATCSVTEPIAYATEVVIYNCGKTTNSSGEPVDYVEPSNQDVVTPDDEPTTVSPSNQATASDSDSPKNDEPQATDTGVTDYYIALGCITAVLCGGLYVLNKKNVFKKI